VKITGKVVALVAVGVLAWCSLQAASAGTSHTQAASVTRTHTAPVLKTRCAWARPRARVLCVHRAPRAVCHDALGADVNVCWWFTGADTQLVFDWRGDVASS
jgi:hypothetical protein